MAARNGQKAVRGESLKLSVARLSNTSEVAEGRVEEERERERGISWGRATSSVADQHAICRNKI